MQNVHIGDKRSVAIDPAEKKALKTIVKYAGTQVAAANLIGVSRVVLWQLLKPGNRTCSPDTRDKLRKFCSENPEIIGQTAAVEIH